VQGGRREESSPRKEQEKEDPPVRPFGKKTHSNESTQDDRSSRKVTLKSGKLRKVRPFASPKSEKTQPAGPKEKKSKDVWQKSKENNKEKKEKIGRRSSRATAQPTK